MVLAKLFFASSGRHAVRSTAVPFLTAPLTIASSDCKHQRCLRAEDHGEHRVMGEPLIRKFEEC